MNNSKKWVKTLNSFDKSLANVVELICTFMLVAIMAIIFMAVICRFILHISTPWSEEFTRFTHISMAFLGMGACLTKNEHIEIDVFAALANKIKNIDTKYLVYKIDDIFRYVFIGSMGGYLLYMYIDYTIKQQKMNQISAGLHLPMWMLYTVLTCGFALLVIHCVLNVIIILGDYKQIRTKESLEGGEV